MNERGVEEFFSRPEERCLDARGVARATLLPPCAQAVSHEESRSVRICSECFLQRWSGTRGRSELLRARLVSSAVKDESLTIQLGPSSTQAARLYGERSFTESLFCAILQVDSRGNRCVISFLIFIASSLRKRL